MKGQKFKKLLASLLTLLLIATSVPLSGNVYAASQTFNLNANGTVKGTYDDSANTLVISGYGQIERSLWRDMANALSGLQEDYINWGYKFNASLKFEAAIEREIALPADSSRLFYNYRGTIDFGQYQIDTSQVTDMSYMFGYASRFNQPINDWDTSNVTDMNHMFFNTGQFNQPLNDWDTSNVTDTSYMFNGAIAFNQPLNNWDTSKVTNMSGTFSSAIVFNQPLDKWDTSAVTNMRGMFSHAFFNQPLNNWDTSKVKDMSGMFHYAMTFNQPLDKWDTSNVVRMYSMFYLAKKFNQPLNNWDTSNVTDMGQMFSFTKKFNQPLNNWDTSNVTNMYAMFSEAQSFNQPLDKWDTSAVTDMRYMFAKTKSFNESIDKWDTSAVTKMSKMFFEAKSFNQPLDNWDISNITSMESMFSHAKSFNQPLNNWDTSAVTNMNYMFYLAEKFNQPLNKWDTSAVKYMSGMFNGATAFNQPLDKWDTSAVTDMSKMFFEAKSFNQPLNNWDTSAVKDMSDMFYGASNYNSAVKLDISGMTGGTSSMFVDTRVKAITLVDNTPKPLVDNPLYYGYSKADLEYFEFNGLTAFTLNGFSGDYVVEKDGAIIAHKSENERFNFEAGAHYKVYRQFKKLLSDCTVDPIATQTLVGDAVTPAVIIKDGNYQLVQGQDYNVSYQNNTAPGTGQVLIEGIGDYQGNLSVTFEIVLSQKSLDDCIILPILMQTTTGGAVTPNIYIIDNGYELVKDKDFTVTYQNNKRSGRARAIIYGIGNYKGDASLSFFIRRRAGRPTKSLFDCIIEPIETQLLVGNYVKPQLIIKYDGLKLIDGIDYFTRYINNDSPGTGYIVIQGIRKYKDSRYVSFDIVAGKKLLSDCSVEPITTQTLMGDSVTPAVIIKNGDYQLVEGQDYTISYQNNTAAGAGQVLIEGKGNYDGNLTVEFLIVNPSNSSDDDDDDDNGNLSNDTIIIAVPDNTPLGNATETPTQPQQLLPLPSFNDVPVSAWYYRSINFLAAYGIIRGTENYQYMPNQPANRAMVATMLYRLSGEPATNGNMPFNDVIGGRWYSAPVNWAQQHGIVRGDQRGFFKPLKAISRQDLVVMLYRYAVIRQYDVTGRAQLSQRYWDSMKIAPYATNAMQWAVQNGIIEGVSENRLAPRGRASRAQAAMIVTRFMQHYLKK